MGSVINSNSMALLEKSLDAMWLRQQVIANNIANASTPNYKSRHVEFEKVLESRLESTGGEEASVREAIEGADPAIVQDDTTAAIEDGNNVDLDSENIEMARAQMQYSYLTSSLNSQIRRLKYVMTEGRA